MFIPTPGAAPRIPAHHHRMQEREETVTTSLKAYTVCTLASLAAVIAVTVGVRTYAWLWAAWAVLAAANAALIATHRD